jgi:hypothetical protein
MRQIKKFELTKIFLNFALSADIILSVSNSWLPRSKSAHRLGCPDSDNAAHTDLLKVVLNTIEAIPWGDVDP